MKIWKAFIALAFLVEAAYAQNLTGTLQKIKETKRIAVGFQEASVPFSYLDGNQKPIGFTLDICAKIVDAVKKELNLPQLTVEFVPVTSANRTPLLINGTIDMNCASTTNNAERQQQISFANSHFVTASRLVSKKAQNIRTLEDLKGKTVASVAGSTNLNQLNKVNIDRNLGMTVLSAKDQLEGFMLVDSGRVVAYAGDDVQLAVAMARSKEPASYVISEVALSKPEPYGIMLRKDDPQFKAIADRVTAALYQSNEMEPLYKKWFQSPIPPNGVNFNYPVPAALRNAWKKPTSSPDPDAYAN